MFSAANIAGGRRRIVTPPANTGLIDFTGTDGSTWPGDFTGVGNSGTIISEIRSNQGYLEIVTTSGRAGRYWSTAAASADVVYTYDFSFPVQKGQTFIFSVMDDGATSSGSAYPLNGYFIELAAASSATGASFYTNKRVAGTNTSLNSAFSQTLTAGVAYRVKLEHTSAGLFRWKIWDTAGAEPGAWTKSYTDTSITTPGKSRLGMTGSAVTATFDNATYTATS